MSDETDYVDFCIEGYDPLPVVFRDMSDVRSFKTKYWKYDFGDSLVYGCDTQNKTLNDVAGFQLPGDKDLWTAASSHSAFKVNIDHFHNKCPKCLMKMDYNNYSSYHCTSNATQHYTGINFKSSSSNSNGNSVTFYTDDPSNNTRRFRRLPNTSGNNGIVYVDVTGIDDSIIEDQCGRNNCEFEYDFGNSVMHIYKGPGLYYATMTCSSETGLRGMEVADETFGVGTPDEKEKVAGCWINVLPECPCVSGFRVYGPVNISGAQNFVTITNSGFSCDTSAVSSVTGYVPGFNCRVEFEDFNGALRTTSAISGYAPYMRVAASGVMVSRSLPVTGAWIDWSDWATDYTPGDEKKFGAILKGWPTWDTGSNRAVTGEHTYTLPGLYSVGISPEFDTQRITTYMPTVVGYEDCVDTTLRRSASGCCVLVVEIPPKSNGITYDSASEKVASATHPSLLKKIKASFIAGSYPISRIDWDFGDGSEIMTISTEAYKIVDKDVSGNETGSPPTSYTNATTTAVKVSGQSTACSGYFIGNPDGGGTWSAGYHRWDCRNYELDHVYTRTSVDDHPNGYIIRCSAYAENTNTCAVQTKVVFSPSGAGLPHFDEVEEYVEMSDVRSDHTGETNIVLQSKNENRLYVNRVSNTDDDLDFGGDETPAFPPKSDENDDPVFGDVIYCFDGNGGNGLGVNRFVMCFKDEYKTLSRGPVFVGTVIDRDQFDKPWRVKLSVTSDLYDGLRTFDSGKKVFEFDVNLDWVLINEFGVEIDPKDIMYCYDPMAKWGKYPPQKLRIVIDEAAGEEDEITTGTATVSLLVGERYDSEEGIIIYGTLLSHQFEYSRTVVIDDPSRVYDFVTDIEGDIFGVYNAEKIDSSKPVTIWWGDDFISIIHDVSFVSKVHRYKSSGKYTVKIENVKNVSFDFSDDVADKITWQQVRCVMENVEKTIDVPYRGFFGCKELKNVNVFDGSRTIGKNAFSGCESLLSVTIPSSVIRIEDGAFDDCRSLGSIIVTGMTRKELNRRVEGGSWKLTNDDLLIVKCDDE